MADARAGAPLRLIIPTHWSVWGCFDYGFIHPSAFYLLTEFDGEITITGEHVEAKKLSRDHAETMRRIAAKHSRDISDIPVFAGPDVFANKGGENAKTIAQQCEAHGMYMVAAPNDRISGWGEMLDLLGDPG